MVAPSPAFVGLLRRACRLAICGLSTALLLAGDPAPVGAAPAAPAKGTAAGQKPILTLKSRGKIVPLSPGRGPRVSLDVRGIDVRTVLTVLSESSRTRFRIAPEVRGSVSYNRRDLALEDMLDAILPPLGLRWTRLSAKEYRVERAVEKQTGQSLLSAPRGWDPAGLRAVFFSDTSCELPGGDLSALLAVLPEGVTPVTRTDARPGGTWAGAGPAPKVGPAHWSARWTGRLWVPGDDAYTFAFKPVRGAALLLLDDGLVLDAWRPNARSESHTGKPVKLGRGWHDVTIEYHQTEAEGALALTWQAPWLAAETIGIYQPAGSAYRSKGR